MFTEITVCNSEDHDQTPHFVASDLGLHCLPMSPRHKRFKYLFEHIERHIKVDGLGHKHAVR